MSIEKSNSLRSLAINRLSGDLIEEPGNRGKDSTSFCLLIVDEFSAKILSNYLSMTDILNKGVFSVESIYRARENFPLYQGIYFISPTIKSCKCLADDFIDKDNVKYKKAHIFFTHKASEECLKALVNEGIINRTVTCAEFNLSFYTVSPNVFDLKLESGMEILKADNHYQDKLIDVISKRLLTVCANLKALPIIQYQKNSKICIKLAKAMDLLIPTLPFKGKREGLLLLTDRTIDLTTPLLHDYNYEAMTYDFFDIKDGKLEIKGKKIELKNTDDLWDTYRSLHIAEVFERLSKDLEEFKKSDISKAGDVSNLETFEGMASALSGMNAYKLKTSQFSSQITLASELNDLYKKNNIFDIIEEEQDVVTGEKNGKKINPRDLFKNFTILKSKLQDQRLDTIRLLVLLYISLSIADKDFKVLAGKLNPEEQQIFDNLKKYFNIKESTIGAIRDKPLTSRNRLSLTSNLNNAKNYSSLRGSPQLEILVEKASNYKLDLDEYPLYNWTQELPTVETKYGTKNLFSGLNLNEEEDEDLKHLICFTIGGISRNEIAALEKIEKNNLLNHKLIIGSTNIINAKEFLKEIQDLSKDNTDLIKKDCFELFGGKDSILKENTLVKKEEIKISAE